MQNKPTVRRTSAEILGKLEVQEAVEPLVLALRDPDPDVRGAALDALRLLHASEAVEPIAACLSDPAPAVRARAIDATTSRASMARPRALFRFARTFTRSSAPTASGSPSARMGTNPPRSSFA